VDAQAHSADQQSASLMQEAMPVNAVPSLWEHDQYDARLSILM